MTFPFLWLKKAACIFACLLIPLFAESTEEYPRPVSEYVEEISPDELVILSYPKYYRDGEGNLLPINTRLQPSADPAWDYEVVSGLWQLKVKNNGTFQVEHEGDCFTYRLNTLGYGVGSKFFDGKKIEPDFSQVVVMGDTIRWSNVFPSVDLVVRYLNDMLKVDVVIKKEIMRELKAQVSAGQLDREEYLTAQFEIPQIILTSRPKRNKEYINLYEQSVPVADRPLEFVKNDKLVHKLREVETYVLDEAGNPIWPHASNGYKPIAGKMIWKLREGQPGVAELSAKIGDLADTPDGDVVIDPSMSFASPFLNDTYVDRSTPSTNYGPGAFLALGHKVVNGAYFEKQILMSLENLNAKLGNVEHIINSASLILHYANWASRDLNAYAQSYKVTQDWNETGVNWNSNVKYDTTISGQPTPLPWSSGAFGPDELAFDVTAPFISHYQSISAFDYGKDNPFMSKKGFLLKLTSVVPNEWLFISTENFAISSRPRLLVNFTRKTNNVPGSIPRFNVSIVQNHNNPLTSTETGEMLNLAQRLLAERDLFNGINNPAYEHLQSSRVGMSKNVILDASFPSTLFWGSPSDGRWRSRLSEERTTRVAIPEYIYLYDLSDPIRPFYRGSIAYSTSSSEDGYPLIFCSRIVAQIDPLTGKLISGTEKSTNQLAHEFLHELGHSVGLNHMHVQDRNGVHGSNRFSSIPLGSAGSAFDFIQCYYFQQFVGLRNRGNIRPGETYPDPENSLFGIPQPVVWSR